MANTDILREFLVKLGFKIDESGERKFADTVASMTVKAVKLGAAMMAASASVTAGVAKIASGLEALHFASQRSRASVANIQALGFAVGQMGGSAEGARASLENLARLMRANPGAQGLLRSLGVSTRDANGKLRDTSQILMDLGKRFAQMPYYRANAYAQALGIDEKTLRALQQGLGPFSDTYRDMLRAAGLDAEQAARSSHTFMNELRTLGGAGRLLLQKVASLLSGKMSADIRRFREWLVAHFDQIASAIQSVVGWMLKAADVISTLAIRAMQAISRIIGWFNGLSDSSRHLIKMLGLMLVAWRVLNAGFMTTPLGRIMALATALLLLWDDYQTWKEGGKSLIDWSRWKPAIKAAIEGIKTLGHWLDKGAQSIGGWRTAAELLLVYIGGKWVIGMLASIGKVGKALLGIRPPAPAAPAAAAGQGVLGRLFTWAVNPATVGLAAMFYSKSLNTGEEAYLKQHRAGAQNINGAYPTIDRNDEEFDKIIELPADGLKYAPRGIRNNNPGNIEYGKFARSHGAIGSDGRFARFRSAEEGLKALAALLQVYARKGIDTIRRIISRYAPANENKTQAYIASVTKRLGFDADARLNMSEPQMLGRLMNAIVQFENGKNPYSAEMLDRTTSAIAATNNPNPYYIATNTSPSGAASADTASQRNISMNPTTNITVNGVNDPNEIAHAISQAQTNVNAMMIRNMRGAVMA